MAGREELRVHICSGTHLNIPLICDGDLKEFLLRMTYPTVVDAINSNLNASAIVWPKDGAIESIVVDAGQTLLLDDATRIPHKIRGSHPSFALDKIFSQAVVYGVFFRCEGGLNDNSAESIRLALFDIGEYDGERFHDLHVTQRQARLRHIFGNAWYTLQHQAMTALCKRLQSERSDDLRQLGQEILAWREDGNCDWTPEFLNEFASYEFEPARRHKQVIEKMLEMQHIVHPIPPHIQLHPMLTTGQCLNIQNQRVTNLPGSPVFGGVIQLPEYLSPQASCSCVLRM
tara:strand:- start:1351 stop:2211 length:861 start_codon:yes stop_codon:yes gene_type:complete